MYVVNAYPKYHLAASLASRPYENNSVIEGLLVFAAVIHVLSSNVNVELQTLFFFHCCLFLFLMFTFFQ
jgi:hypothetical protein